MLDDDDDDDDDDAMKMAIIFEAVKFRATHS